MIMADVLMWFLLIVGALIVFVSYWLVTQALFPNLVVRSRARYQTPVRVTLLGLIVAVPLVMLGFWVFRIAPNPMLKSGGFLLVALPVLVGLVGSSGLAQRIGAGLASPADEMQPWRRVLRGGIVLAFTFLLPFAGWFVILPWTLISGFGAALLSFWPGRTVTQPAEPAAALSPVSGVTG